MPRQQSVPGLFERVDIQPAFETAGHLSDIHSGLGSIDSVKQQSCCIGESG
jgi:hypothetical protein